MNKYNGWILNKLKFDDFVRCEIPIQNIGGNKNKRSYSKSTLVDAIIRYRLQAIEPEFDPYICGQRPFILLPRHRSSIIRTLACYPFENEPNIIDGGSSKYKRIKTVKTISKDFKYIKGGKTIYE